MVETTDIIVIGGGPVGLFGLYCAGLHHLRAVLLERLDRVGGQLEHLYPEKPIYDVGGFPRITGHELIEQLKLQAFQYPVEVITETEAESIETGIGGTYRIKTHRGIYTGRSVLITGGIGRFNPRRMNNPAIDRYEGKGLYYVVSRLKAFDHKRVLIVGGGDSAADWAMALSDRASELFMIHRRASFQCHIDSLRKLEANPRVTLIPSAELVGIGGDDRVEEVHVRRAGAEADTRSLSVDAVIVAIGLIPGTEVFQRFGLAMRGDEVEVSPDMRTNRDGVYAAGDLVSYPGKVKLIAAGFGEVATAVEGAHQYIRSISSRQ